MCALRRCECDLPTIAGQQKVHYGLIYGTTFPGTAATPNNGPGYAEIA
ncbi:hypothetical protein [Aliiroseovarius sp. F20344]|nr:hypothetical protein [Aliiroseovarius sp. F20344]MCK0142024.1 hypothetical protein [Aliiroseovarius sp. F20344]